MTIEKFEQKMQPQTESKYKVERDRRSARLTMMVRSGNTIQQSVTTLSVRHAATFVSMLEAQEVGRIVMTDGAGSIGLHAHANSDQSQLIEVRGKLGSLSGFCLHGAQNEELIRDLRSVLLEIAQL